MEGLQVFKQKYAPEYDYSERKLFLLKFLLVGLGLFSLGQYFIRTLSNDNIVSFYCSDFGFVSGQQLYYYLMYCMGPFVFGLIVFCFEGVRSFKVLILGVNPLPGEKVFFKTRYTFGWRARVKPVLTMLVLLLMSGTGTWGGVVANKKIVETKYKINTICVENEGNEIGKIGVLK